MEEIFVTAPRIQSAYSSFLFNYSFNPFTFDVGSIGSYQALNDAFVGEEGVFGYKFANSPLIIIDESDYTDKEVGMLRKLFNEIENSPLLGAAFARMKANGNIIKIHNDGFIHDFNGAKVAFVGKYSDSVAATSEDFRGTNGDFAAANTVINISLNDPKNNFFSVFRDSVVHELVHLALAGTHEEAAVKYITGSIIRDIFKTDGTWETDYFDYFKAGGAEGTEGVDNIIGGPGYDVIQGHGGDDHLSGGGGNDYLLGGAGSDVLSGGPGSDVLVSGAARTGKNEIFNGGPGDDLYLLQYYGAKRVIDDTSGTDWLEFEHETTLTNVYDISEDCMIIIGGSTYSTVYIENWSNGGTIEHIILSGGSEYTLGDVVI